MCIKYISILGFLVLFLIVETLAASKVEAEMVENDDDDDEDDDNSDMKTVEMETLVEPSRKILADIVQKGQFFQDIFAENVAPLKIQFGHVCENPNEWEQRFEQKDFEKNHHQGKVRWGNRNGGYGEHYWDLNHHNGK
ncbi:uncharacterized protein LOC107272309 [Cephus cinctus]|uniref:Uncharacterized protein LOC107272309 n=1 Tax=Cephus cinctus TaxID=211228 RepID=A0AAJ7C8W4_CEPCN|nr:uncharacterized protein LOC107272309 [Cephus cinctus]